MLLKRSKKVNHQTGVTSVKSLVKNQKHYTIKYVAFNKFGVMTSESSIQYNTYVFANTAFSR